MCLVPWISLPTVDRFEVFLFFNLCFNFLNRNCECSDIHLEEHIEKTVPKTATQARQKHHCCLFFQLFENWDLMINSNSKSLSFNSLGRDIFFLRASKSYSEMPHKRGAHLLVFLHFVHPPRSYEAPRLLTFLKLCAPKAHLLENFQNF